MEIIEKALKEGKKDVNALASAFLELQHDPDSDDDLEEFMERAAERGISVNKMDLQTAIHELLDLREAEELEEKLPGRA